MADNTFVDVQGTIIKRKNILISFDILTCTMTTNILNILGNYFERVRKKHKFNSEIKQEDNFFFPRKDIENA